MFRDLLYPPESYRFPKLFRLNVATRCNFYHFASFRTWQSVAQFRSCVRIVKMDLILKIGLRSLSINIFFKKSFQLSNLKMVFITLLLSLLQDYLPTLYFYLASLLICVFIWKTFWFKILRNVDAQDATNFIMVYFTLLVLNNLEYPRDLPLVWSCIPKLSLFQIIRKPDSLKKWIRPIRVALAPVSFILTIFASISQIYFHSNNFES